jgi:hypothetical protein
VKHVEQSTKASPAEHKKVEQVAEKTKKEPTPVVPIQQQVQSGIPMMPMMNQMPMQSMMNSMAMP